ncbi:MAG: hypothetical protein R3A80_07730 [Bdellovibrionota bacterium]
MSKTNYLLELQLLFLATLFFVYSVSDSLRSSIPNSQVGSFSPIQLSPLRPLGESTFGSRDHAKKSDSNHYYGCPNRKKGRKVKESLNC